MVDKLESKIDAPKQPSGDNEWEWQEIFETEETDNSGNEE